MNRDAIGWGSAAVAVAASADVAWQVYTRFADDAGGLSALERAQAALWDLRPLASALFLLAAMGVLLVRPHGSLRRLVAPLAGAHAALGVAVLIFAVWVAATGRIGATDELSFSYALGERVVTLATQALGWGVLVAALAVLAWRASAPEPEAPRPDEPSVLPEAEALWRERLAFGPRREKARSLLARIQASERDGDHETARRLADELRRL